jgi:hypothetical protein
LSEETRKEIELARKQYKEGKYINIEDFEKKYSP